MSRAVNPVELRTCFSGIELRSDSARNSRSVVALLQQAGVRLGAAKRLGGAGGLSEEEVTHVGPEQRGEPAYALSLWSAVLLRWALLQEGTSDPK